MSNNTYPVKLSNGSATLLRYLLNQPGWTKTVTEFITAAQLLACVIPEAPQQPERPHPAITPNYAQALEEWKKTDAEWAKGEVSEFTLTEKQRDNVKACLKHAVEKQQAIPSKPAFDLFSIFGLTE